MYERRKAVRQRIRKNTWTSVLLTDVPTSVPIESFSAVGPLISCECEGAGNRKR